MEQSDRLDDRADVLHPVTGHSMHKGTLHRVRCITLNSSLWLCLPSTELPASPGFTVCCICSTPAASDSSHALARTALTRTSSWLPIPPSLNFPFLSSPLL